MTVPSSKKKSRPVSSTDRITLACVSLIVGALCLRLFVLPTRRVLTRMDAADYSSLAVHRPIMDHPPQQFERRLAINPGGTLASDVLSIEHVPERSAVVVTLNPTGRCPNPYLRGRLSGPAIVLLEWTRQDQQQELVGHYGRVPLSGPYFVEIVAITCQDFSHDVEFDFQTTCLEDPSNHRVTKSNARIYIDVQNNHNNPLLPNQLFGHWIHQQDERAAHNDYSALYTRYQPRGCLRLNDPSHEHFHVPPQHCIEPTDWNRFEPYTSFRYGYSQEDRGFLYQARRIRAPQPTTICLVGGSHSRTLKASLINYHNFTLANNIQIEWINAKFPRNLPNATILNDIQGTCHKVLLAVGQWPASFSGHRPTLFKAYQLEMTKLLGRLRDHAPSTQVWTRSIHENPLNERIAGYCPPKDWRSPTVLEGYNSILWELAQTKTASHQFVDTSFIVSPLWDASTDWGHVCPQASHVEALYLVAVVLGLVEPHQGIHANTT